MNELLLEAREELKRLEHIIYVSLKYTRTGDVLNNALHHLVSVFDFIIGAFLERELAEKKISSIAKSPARRATILGDLYPKDADLQRHLTFYRFLKTMLKLPQRRRQEYRRHVTIIVDLPFSTGEIKSDSLINMEKFAHRFLEYAVEKLGK